MKPRIVDAAPKCSAPPRVRKTPPARQRAEIPIVGIGASAGGLEALEQFLAHTPADSGCAFVVVQHLDPTRKGILPELLQRATHMPVAQIKDRTRVCPNAVYVIPPNRDLSILHGRLQLLPPAAPRGLRLPIDFFFRALAADQQARSIGVVLSGMGTDGTLGLRAIKEHGGLALVQDPASARFDSMPRSALDAALADIVAPAAALPERLLAYLRHAPASALATRPRADTTHPTIEKVLLVLRERTGHDFAHYKRSTLTRRVERRMGLHQLGTIAAYLRFVQANPAELDLLFKEFLIGVTSFFRDPGAWERLATRLVPRLAGHPVGQPLRAWVAGCATGEEAYSLAMVLKEAAARAPGTRALTVQIFATDLDRDAIERARQGVFPANIAADVSPERLHRFFVKDDRGYRIGKEIRDAVTFATQNLITDPPFTKLDLLSCRNVLIYLDPELQRKLLPLFHYSLSPGGVLFLGSAETAGRSPALFTPLDDKARLYQRREGASAPEAVVFPAVPAVGWQLPEARAGVPTPPDSLQALADQLLLSQYAPPAVLATAEGDILYICGRTGKYLEPASGKVNWNLVAMAREGLRPGLAGALRQAVRSQEAVTLAAVPVRTEGGVEAVDVVIQALREPEALRGMILCVFRSVPTVPAPSTGRQPAARARSGATVAALERELQKAREEVRVTREEAQAAHEELKSANEELQSTNEELQSTNEELTTSREELQSVNEELQTVNAELQSKVDELSRTNNDMRNLLNSTEIATVFLDGTLRVRRFTTQAIALFNFIPGDVGRPVTDLASDLVYPDLPADAQAVLRNLIPIEKELSSKGGRWFKGRLMPYRTAEDKIDGVVITFTEISAAKTLEAELRRALSTSQAPRDA